MTLLLLAYTHVVFRANFVLFIFQRMLLLLEGAFWMHTGTRHHVENLWGEKVKGTVASGNFWRAGNVHHQFGRDLERGGTAE